MSYKPDEKDWMAYLYGELEGEEKAKFDQYLIENKEAQQELGKFKELRKMIAFAEDKEVIAPPIFVNERHSAGGAIWNSPYLKTVLSIAASLIIIVLIGKLTGASMTISGNEFKLSFGGQQNRETTTQNTVSLTAAQVQNMIDHSLQNNNTAMQASWKENEQQLTASIRKNLAVNSKEINALVNQASTASQEQIRQYVSGIQAENTQLVRNYFQLTAADQKQYIESLLVDFAQYLQQQRENDLQVVQTRLNSLEKNTDLFKQETEQILTSIITTVGTPGTKEIRN